MSRVATLTFLLAGAGLSSILACSGPSPMPAQDAGFAGAGGGAVAVDAGFYGNPNDPWGLNGTGGTGGTAGTGGAAGGAGGNTGGAGGRDGETNPKRRDAGAEPARQDGGGTDPVNGADAAPPAVCPPGTKNDGPCAPNERGTCVVPVGDGGGGEVCSCKGRGNDRQWKCEMAKP